MQSPCSERPDPAQPSVIDTLPPFPLPGPMLLGQPLIRKQPPSQLSRGPAPFLFWHQGWEGPGVLCFLGLRPTFSGALPLGRAQPLMNGQDSTAEGKQKLKMPARGMGQTLAVESRTEAAPTGGGAGWCSLHPTPAWYLVVIQYPGKTLGRMEKEAWGSALQIFISSPVLGRSVHHQSPQRPNSLEQ